MAIFHASLRSFSRSRGESATAAVAYRGGLRVADDRTGLVHDYRARLGVEAVFTCAPKSAPAWATTPETLWNAVEKYERRVNSVLARELVVALPAELSPDQRQGLARRLTDMVVERYGVAATAAVHDPSRSGDDRNFHTHILMTTRVVGASGFGEKIRVLNDPRTGPTELKNLRALVAEHTNSALAIAGRAERVDHRTLRAQAADAARRGDLDAVVRLAREPTQHEGKAATAAQRRGEPSPRAAANITTRRANDITVAAGRSRVRAFRAAHASLPITPARSRSAVREPFLGSIEFHARATGPGARLQNQEATQRQRALRIERNNLRAYIEGLRRTVELAEASFNAYVRALRLSSAEFERLAALIQVNGERARAFREAAECYSLYELAVQTHAQRRAGVARAQVAADRARHAVEHTEQARPPVFKPLSRRAWAEKRRAERRALVEAEGRELAAARGASSDDVEAAEARWRAAEARRRSVLQLPGDGRRAAADGIPAAATSPAVPEAGPPGGAPVEPRPPQQRPPAPRPRPARRPRI
ncbi:MobQ family relaxase [Tahibacter soli]|uniref:MobA/MobL family protein n=1 Tax=Tahibacter soli TaxID=2983605 RepID=A0A9X3YFG0_9GAMM|nr:MobQ family relaxase [Tahibacter soli]MDC8010959.1 MobA/MobL family protein [Tahibacter soli]